MTKLLCPHCTKLVAVPDDAAGRETTCPECGKPFPVPARYNPVVAADPLPTRGLTSPGSPVVPPPPEPLPMSTAPPDRPAPPPGLVPPAPPSTALEPPLPPTPPVPSVPLGYTRSIGFNISPKGVAWLPAVGLSLILALTLFNWAGSYIGGTPLWAQGAWRALAGTVDRNYKLEVATKEQLKDLPPVLDKVKSDWEVMLPYLVLLILAAVLAWAERLVATLDRNRLPKWLRWVTAIWPYRIPLLAGLSVLLLVLLASQWAAGFGLERAMRAAVAEKFEPQRKAAANSPADLDTIKHSEEQELARYDLEHTTWFYLAVALHVLVVAAMVTRAGLDARGNKPPPRFVLQY